MSKVAKNEFDEMIGAPDFQNNLGEIINPKLEKIAAKRFEQKFQHLLEARIASLDIINQRCNPCQLKIIDTIGASKVNSILEEYEKLKQTSIPKKNDMKINNGKSNCKKRKSLLRNVQFQKRVDELFDQAIPEKTVGIDQEIDQIIKYLIEQIQEILKKMERCEQCYQKEGNKESGDQKTYLNKVEPAKKQGHGESVAKVEPKKNQGCLEEQNDNVEPEKNPGSGGQKTFLNKVEPKKKRGNGEKIELEKKQGNEANNERKENVEPTKKNGYGGNSKIEPKKNSDQAGLGKISAKIEPMKKGHRGKVEPEKKQGNGTIKGQDDVSSICPLCNRKVTGKDKSTCYRNVCRHIRNIHDKDPEDFEIKTEIQVQPTKKRGREEWDKSVSEVEPKKKRARNVKNKGAI